MGNGLNVQQQAVGSEKIVTGNPRFGLLDVKNRFPKNIHNVGQRPQRNVKWVDVVRSQDPGQTVASSNLGQPLWPGCRAPFGVMRGGAAGLRPGSAWQDPPSRVESHRHVSWPTVSSLSTFSVSPLSPVAQRLFY